MKPRSFVTDIATQAPANPAGNVFDGIWNEYEKVVLHSLLTSFGLDFLVHDQQGGDVDTIRSVRATGNFKDPKARAAYEARGEYDPHAYHSDPRYREITKRAREAFNADGTMIEDAYIPGNMVAPNRARHMETVNGGTNKRANLDHVVSAHEIHDDPGRILAGIDGRDLANSPDNLRFTNEHTNKSKSDMSMDEFLETRGAGLPEEAKAQMREVDVASREAILQKLNDAYYTSEDFFVSMTAAAASRGIEMGLRQALGFVLVEIWFSCKEALQEVPVNSDVKDYFSAIAHGIENGVKIITEKHSGLLESFGAGFVTGSLASLTTTLCNIFFETQENTIRNLRNAYASIVHAGNILLFNPNNLLLGDRIQAATVVLATGANVLIGSYVGDMIAETPLGKNEQVGRPLRIFASTLVSGILSCTFLLILDRSSFINNVVNKLNRYLTEGQTFALIASQFESMAAEVGEFDVEQFRIDVEKYSPIAEKLATITEESEINELLSSVFIVCGIKPAWQGNLHSFMGNRYNQLVFE